MRIHLHKPEFLIQYSEDRRTNAIPKSHSWDGQALLSLGHPTRYVLQRKGDEILIRNFAAPEEVKSALQSIKLADDNFGQRIILSSNGRDSITIRPIHQIAPVDPNEVARIPHFELPNTGSYSVDDRLYNKYLQRFSATVALLFISMFVFKPAEPELAVNEELIPKKFAKIIMTKPKEKMAAPAAGGSTQSQAQVKAVARAFQSTSVQKSMKSILKGGLTKYSIMSTGKAIQNLSQKIASNTNVVGAGLQNKASDILAGSRVGNFQIGSDSGYGSGTGANVKGQGSGQAMIGLITDDAQVDEGLTKEEIAKVIHAHMSEIRYCYESAILRDPTLAGKVLINFKVNAGGLVPSAGITEDSISDKQVGTCLAGKLRQWKFPQPRGGVMVAVTYPFVFKSLSR